MKGDSYTNVILEDINSKFDRLIEVVANMQEQLTRKADKDDITNLVQRVEVLEYSIRQMSLKITN